MKRTATVLISALLFLIVSACDDSSNTNTISVAELTDRENAILSSSTDQSFVYDFSTDKEYKEVTVWIEKYESGNLVEGKIGELMTQVEGEGSIIFTTSKTDPGQKQLTFNIAVGDKEGFSSVSANDGNSIDLDDMSSVWGSLRGDNTSIEGEVVLGNICYSNNQIMNSLTAEFYEDVNGHINEIEKYDVVYLLKADFHK